MPSRPRRLVREDLLDPWRRKCLLRLVVDVGGFLPKDAQQRVERVAESPDVCFHPPGGKVEEVILSSDLAREVEPLNSET